MPTFEMEVSLPVDPRQLPAELFCLPGVNYELGPLLSMTAPADWLGKPIAEWPTETFLFTSRVCVLGFIPIDLHRFRLLSVDAMGFDESSTTLLNRVWSHRRTITGSDNSAIVKDTVTYESRLGPVGGLLAPVYRSVFAHRHRRLKARYADINS